MDKSETKTVRQNPSGSKKLEPSILWTRILSGYLMGMSVILGILFFSFWNSRFDNNEVEKSSLESIILDSIIVNNDTVAVPHSVDALPKGAIKHSIDEDVLIALAIIVGAFGALLHAIVSIGVFAGNRSFDDEWSLWYFFRPFVGGLLALLVYFIIRAGFLSGIQGSSGIYTVLAVSGLTGMFSKQALEKLSELFDVIFQSKKPAGYKGQLVKNNPSPKIISVDPETVDINSEDVPVTISGNGFMKSSKVRINNEPVVTEYASESELKAVVNDPDQYKTDSLRVRVFNEAPGGGLSEPVVIKLVKPNATPG